MPQRILVVDDEAKLVHVVRGYLEQAGFEVASAANGRDALFVARSFNPDLIVLDLMMPVLDGRGFLLEYRREGNNVPIVVLTAQVEEADKVITLELGADDYVVKPFSPRELLARVRAVLRRAGPAAATPPGDELRVAGLVLNRNTHSLVAGGRAIELTPMEYELLNVLMSNPGRAFSRLELLERAQGYAYEGYERTVDVHIKNLRKKLEADPSDPTLILTVFKVGYRFNPAA